MSPKLPDQLETQSTQTIHTLHTNSTCLSGNLAVWFKKCAHNYLCAGRHLDAGHLSCFYCSDSLRPFYRKDTVKTLKHSEIKSGWLYRSCVWWAVVHVEETRIWTLSDPVKLDDELQPNVIHQNERSSKLFTQTRTINTTKYSVILDSVAALMVGIMLTLFLRFKKKDFCILEKNFYWENMQNGSGITYFREKRLLEALLSKSQLPKTNGWYQHVS